MDKDLDALTREILDLMHSHTPAKIPANDLGLICGIGWSVLIRKTIEAILILDATGYAGESSPLVRQAVEHLVSIEWLNANGKKGLDWLMAEHKMWAERLKKAIAKTEGWDSITPDIFEKLAAVSVPASGLDGHVKMKFETVGKVDLYVSYLTETNFSHPTLNSANNYLDTDLKGNYIPLEKARSEGLGTLSARCVVVAFFGARAMANLIRSDEMAGKLNEIEQRMVASLSSNRE